MKNIIKLFFLLYSLNTYSQTKENQNDILFNSLSDTIITLNELATSFKISSNITDSCKIEVTHIRENRLVSLILYTLMNFKYNYNTQPLTNDIFLVQLISIQSDSILQHKIFHFINLYVDNITKSITDSLNNCKDAIHKPYTFAFNIFINDKKTNDYEVIFFRIFRTTKTFEHESTSIYSDSIAAKHNGNIFYLSKKMIL